MHPELGGGQREDQPAVTGIDVCHSEYVAEEDVCAPVITVGPPS